MSEKFEPTLVYICPGDHACPGGTYSFAPAKDSKELDDLLEAGYSLTLPEAIEGPATREELEAKCKELDIKFSANYKNTTLKKKIDEAVAQSDKD